MTLKNHPGVPGSIHRGRPPSTEMMAPCPTARKVDASEEKSSCVMKAVLSLAQADKTGPLAFKFHVRARLEPSTEMTSGSPGGHEWMKRA